MNPNSADSSARVFSPDSDAIATRALNSALCCFLFTPTSHVLWTGQPLAYPAVQKSGTAAPGRLCGIELPIALCDAAGPLVSGNRGADMVRASTFACSGDFLLRLAGCQGKNLIVKAQRGAAAAS